MNISIREGREEDLPEIFELIKELALFEKAPEQVTNTIDRMRKEGFGDNPVYSFFVAENQSGIIGAAIHYIRYSTWKGARLFLEDLIVKESFRGLGAGSLLFEKCIELGKKQGYSGMTWQVLDWNQPAIDLYNKYNSQLEAGWLNANLDY